MSVITSLVLSIFVGIFITLCCIYLLKPVAMHIGLVDVPGGRKTHVNVIPLIGGISIFFGFCFALLCLNISLHNYRGLLAGSAILVLIGVMDDFRELTPRIRLVGQCLATLLLIEWGHITVDHLGNLFFLGNINLGVYSLFFTIFFVLGFINSINMIDGHDGLAGLIVLGQAFFFALLSVQLHQIFNFYLLLIFIAVLCVFLIFNLPISRHKRVSIFMGDAGSTFIGFIIAWFAVDLSQVMFVHKNMTLHYSPMTILWVLAYPLYDLLFVIIYRLVTNRSPFSASHDHLHYLLSDRGFQRMSVAVVLFIFSVLLGLIGLFLSEQKMPESWQLMCFIGTLFVYFWVMFFFISARTKQSLMIG